MPPSPQLFPGHPQRFSRTESRHERQPTTPTFSWSKHQPLATMPPPLLHESELGPMPSTKGEARAQWFQQVIDFYQNRNLPFPTAVVEGFAGKSKITSSIRCHPSHPVSLTPGWVKGRILNTEASNYVNAMLIQSRGALSSVPCESCIGNKSRKPFLDCVRSPGNFHGACGNCKWREEACWCSVRDEAQPPPPPLSTDQPWNQVPRILSASGVASGVASAGAPAGTPAPTIDLTEDPKDVIDLT